MHVGEYAARCREIQGKSCVDVNDLTEATALDQAEDALHGSAEVVRVILDQPALRGRSRRAEREPLGVAGRDGLLDQRVRTGRQTAHREGNVRADRGGDVHDLGPDLVEHGAEVRVVMREPEALGRELRRHRREVANSDLEVRDLVERAKMLLGDAAGSDDGDPHVAFRAPVLYSISVDGRRRRRVSQ